MSSLKTIVTRSSGKRKIILPNYKELLSFEKPNKKLTKSIKNQAGRNAQGKITVRHHGGDSKRKYREIDFKRNKYDIVATVKTIEYDPNRTAFISLICYADGTKNYILAPQGIKVGDKVIASDLTDVKLGNAMRIKNIPDGTFVHNVELVPGQGGKMARSAGTQAQILGKDETGKYVIVKLSSGEMRKVPNDAFASIGSVSNQEHNITCVGKAGTNRHLGIKPTVRGSAMNPCDHPHGGGEGRQGVGRPGPLDP
jgi:large subunit ribosomal protein L2